MCEYIYSTKLDFYYTSEIVVKIGTKYKFPNKDLIGIIKFHEELNEPYLKQFKYKIKAEETFRKLNRNQKIYIFIKKSIGFISDLK